MCADGHRHARWPPMLLCHATRALSMPPEEDAARARQRARQANQRLQARQGRSRSLLSWPQVFFVVDIILNFRTAYVENAELVVDKKLIIRK